MSRLPNFLIAGTMKSGTSSLSKWLDAHPDVFVAEEKEVHFFDSEARWRRGVDWYASRFAAAGEAAAAGDATPLYLFYPQAVERMASVLPDARIFVCLRDPVTRAYSQYLHLRDRMAIERRTFAAAIEQELAGDVGRAPVAGEAGLGGPEAKRYVAQGRYAEQLERLCRHYPREAVHVVLLDELSADPEGTFRAACRFLGVDDTILPETVGLHANPHMAHRPLWLWRLMLDLRLFRLLPNRLGRYIAVDLMRRQVTPAPMDPEVRERLGAYFAPYNRDLARWLGRELPPWTGLTADPPA